MQAFTQHQGLVAPMDRANVDTDQIIPKQFLKSIQRTGFGPNLFDEWRYLDEGEPGMDNSVRPLNEEFVLNQARYQGASVLLTRANFGCGSSREHAPWALVDYGFRAIVGESFADIFYNNCFKNGLLPVTLDKAILDTLFAQVADNPGMELLVDLDQQQVRLTDGTVVSDFEVDAFRRHCLLNGLDDIGLTLEQADAIRAYEQRRKPSTPWLFEDVNG